MYIQEKKKCFSDAVRALTSLPLALPISSFVMFICMFVCLLFCQ